MYIALLQIIPPKLSVFSSLSRRHYKHDVKCVIYLQSCVRRRTARKELKVLKQEARSVSKFKEISYKLENKVVELTLSLQKRNQEKKELQESLTELEKQLQSWMSKHEEVDKKAKQLHTELSTNHIPKTKFQELLDNKQHVDERLGETSKKVLEQEDMINKLTEDLRKQTHELEAKQKAMNGAPAKVVEDGATISALKNELSALKDQLNRANALNSLSGNRPRGELPPPSPTFGLGLRTGPPVETNGAGFINSPVGPPSANPTKKSRHLRRHSSAGAYAIESLGSTPESLEDVFARKGRVQDNRATVAFTAADGMPRFRQSGLEDISDDPTEEKIKLLEDADHLDEDVLQGLIRGLKIPIQQQMGNSPSLKEVLFPANLISLITNEMWRYGLIEESERFLANVMQTIQAHVMVRFWTAYYFVG